MKTKREKKGKGERETEERKGERERERGKGALPSLYDLWRSGDRLPTDKELKSKYATRTTCGYENSEFRQGFTWEVCEV